MVQVVVIDVVFVLKKLGPKNFWLKINVQKTLGQKNFGSKKVRSRKCVVKKKMLSKELGFKEI